MQEREYQNQAIENCIQYLKTNAGDPLIVSAMGTGKSIIIAKLIKRLGKANNVRILVCTHVSKLAEQNAKKLRSVCPEADIGMFSAGLKLKQISNDIVFSTIQSVYRLPEDDLKDFNLIIVDECHTISRKAQTMWGALFQKVGKHRKIGLTATDFRMDSGSLTSGDDAMFDDVCFEYGLGRAVADGYLCRLVAKETKTKYDVSKVGKLGGEFNLSELQAATNIDALTKQAVAEIIEKGELRKTWLIFCNGVEHGFAVRDELRRCGITAETVNGETLNADDILEAFNGGSIRAVTVFGMWTTGVDIPGIDLIAMIRHTLSGGLLLQMGGRGTRVTIDLSPYNTPQERKNAIAASDKPNCLFLDFAGNIERHGPLDLIKAREKGKKGEGVAPIKSCPDCASLIHASASKCIDCGHIFQKTETLNIGKAHTGAILSEPEVRKVVDIVYSVHNQNKEGKIPCLMVKYIHPDDSNTREYICLQHTGFAKKKADKWWLERDGGYIDGHPVKAIVDSGMCQYLKKPSEITVIKEGKYERVINYDFTNLLTEANTEDLQSSSSFW